MIILRNFYPSFCARVVIEDKLNSDYPRRAAYNISSDYVDNPNILYKNGIFKSIKSCLGRITLPKNQYFKNYQEW